MSNDKGNVETVTISTEDHNKLLIDEISRRVFEYKELSSINKELRRKLAGNEYATKIHLNTSKRLRDHSVDLTDRIKSLRSRNLFQRIFNL